MAGAASICVLREFDGGDRSNDRVMDCGDGSTAVSTTPGGYHEWLGMASLMHLNGVRLESLDEIEKGAKAEVLNIR